MASQNAFSYAVLVLLVVVSSAAARVNHFESVCSAVTGCPRGAMVWASGSFTQQNVLRESVLRYQPTHSLNETLSAIAEIAAKPREDQHGILWSTTASPIEEPLTLQLSLCCGYTFVREMAASDELYNHFVDELFFHTPIPSRYRRQLFLRKNMRINKDASAIQLVASPLDAAFYLRHDVAVGALDPSTLYVSNKVLHCKCPTTLTVLPMVHFYRDELPDGLHLKGAGPRCQIEGDDDDSIHRPFVVSVVGSELPPLMAVRWRINPSSAVDELNISVSGNTMTLQPPRLNHRVHIEAHVGGHTWAKVLSLPKESIVVRRSFSIAKYRDATGEDLSKYQNLQDIILSVGATSFDFRVAAAAAASQLRLEATQFFNNNTYLVRSLRANDASKLEAAASTLMSLLHIGEDKENEEVGEGEKASESYPNAYIGHWTSSDGSNHHGNVQRLGPGINEFLYDVNDLDDACPPVPVASATVYSMQSVIHHHPKQTPPPSKDLCDPNIALDAQTLEGVFPAFEEAAIAESRGWYAKGDLTGTTSWECNHVTATDVVHAESLGLLDVPNPSSPSLRFNTSLALEESDAATEEEPAASHQDAKKMAPVVIKENRDPHNPFQQFVCAWNVVVKDKKSDLERRPQLLRDASSVALKLWVPPAPESVTVYHHTRKELIVIQAASTTGVWQVKHQGLYPVSAVERPKAQFRPAPTAEVVLERALVWYARLHHRCPEKPIPYHVATYTEPPVAFEPLLDHIYGGRECVTITAKSPERDEIGTWSFVTNANMNGTIPEGSSVETMSVEEADAQRLGGTLSLTQSSPQSTEVKVCGVPELAPVTLVWNVSNVKGSAQKFYVVHQCEPVPRFATPLAAPRLVRLPPPAEGEPAPAPQYHRRHVLVAGSGAKITLDPSFAASAETMTTSDQTMLAHWTSLGGAARLRMRTTVVPDRFNVLNLMSTEQMPGEEPPTAATAALVDHRMLASLSSLRHGVLHNISVRFVPKSSPTNMDGPRPSDDVLLADERETDACPSTFTQFTVVSVHAAKVLIPPRAEWDPTIEAFKIPVCEEAFSVELPADLTMVKYSLEGECSVYEESGVVSGNIHVVHNHTTRIRDQATAIIVPLTMPGSRVLCSLTLTHLLSRTEDTVKVLLTRLYPQKKDEPIAARLYGINAASGNYFIGSDVHLESYHVDPEWNPSHSPEGTIGTWHVTRIVPKEYVPGDFKGSELLAKSVRIAPLTPPKEHCSSSADTCVKLDMFSAGAVVTVEYVTNDEHNPTVCPSLVAPVKIRNYRAEVIAKNGKVVICGGVVALKAVPLPIEMTTGTSIRGRWVVHPSYVDASACKKVEFQNSDTYATIAKDLHFGECVFVWQIERTVYVDDNKDVMGANEPERPTKTVVLDSANLTVYVLTDNLPMKSPIVTTQDHLDLPLTMSSVDWVVVRKPYNMQTEMKVYTETPSSVSGLGAVLGSLAKQNKEKRMKLTNIVHGITRLSYRLAESEKLVGHPTMSGMVCPSGIVRYDSETRKKTTGPYYVEVHRMDVSIAVSTNMQTECDAYSGKGTITLELLSGKGSLPGTQGRSLPFGGMQPIQFINDVELIQRRIEAFGKLHDKFKAVKESSRAKSPWWVTQAPGNVRANWTNVEFAGTNRSKNTLRDKMTITLRTANNEFFDTSDGAIPVLDGLMIPESVVAGVFTPPEYDLCLFGGGIAGGMVEAQGTVQECVERSAHLKVLLYDKTRRYHMRPLQASTAIVSAQVVDEEDLSAGKGRISLQLQPMVSAPPARDFYPTDSARCDIPARDMLSAWRVIPPSKELLEGHRDEQEELARVTKEWAQYLNEVRNDVACVVATPFDFKANGVDIGSGAKKGGVSALSFILNVSLPSAPRFSTSATFHVAMKVPKPLICGVTSTVASEYFSHAAASQHGLIDFGPVKISNEPTRYNVGEDGVPQCALEHDIPPFLMNVTGGTFRHDITLKDITLSVVSPTLAQESEVEKEKGLRTCLPQFLSRGAFVRLRSPRQLELQLMPCKGLQLYDHNDPNAKPNPQVFNIRFKGAVVAGEDALHDLHHDVNIVPTTVTMKLEHPTDELRALAGLPKVESPHAPPQVQLADDNDPVMQAHHMHQPPAATRHHRHIPVHMMKWPNIVCEHTLKYEDGLAITVALHGDNWNGRELGNGEANSHNTALLQAFSVWAPSSTQQKVAEVDSSAAAIGSSVFIEYISRFATVRNVVRINSTAATVYIQPLSDQQRLDVEHSSDSRAKLMSLKHRIEHLHFSMPGHVTVCEGCLLADSRIHIAGDTSGIILSTQEEFFKIEQEVDDDGVITGAHTDGHIYDHATRPLLYSSIHGLPPTIFYEPMCPPTLQQHVLGNNNKDIMNARFGGSPAQVTAIVTLNYNVRNLQEEYVAPFSPLDLAKLVRNVDDMQGRVRLAIGRKKGDKPSSLPFLAAERKRGANASTSQDAGIIGHRYRTVATKKVALTSVRVTVFVCPPFSAMGTNSTTAIRQSCVQSATRLLQLGGSRRSTSTLMDNAAKLVDLRATLRSLGLVDAAGDWTDAAPITLIHHIGTGFLMVRVLCGLAQLVGGTTRDAFDYSPLPIQLAMVAAGTMTIIGVQLYSFMGWIFIWTLLWVLITALHSGSAFVLPYFVLHLVVLFAALK